MMTLKTTPKFETLQLCPANFYCSCYLLCLRSTGCLLNINAWWDNTICIQTHQPPNLNFANIFAIFTSAKFFSCKVDNDQQLFYQRCWNSMTDQLIESIFWLLKLGLEFWSTLCVKIQTLASGSPFHNCFTLHPPSSFQISMSVIW